MSHLGCAALQHMAGPLRPVPISRSAQKLTNFIPESVYLNTDSITFGPMFNILELTGICKS